MARTIEQIQQIILERKAQNTELDVLDSTSKVAIWRLWVYIVSFAIWTLELLFDTHTMQVDEKIKQQKAHTPRWYRNKALAFQYGFDLVEDQDYFDNTGFTDEQIEASKIVKYSAVTEAESESRLIVKIATENGEELTPISEAEKQAFIYYMSEIRDAGVKITVINYLPDILELNLQIYRDPLVLNSEGVNILTGEKSVEKAIKEYMKLLPFDGELVLAHLVDYLQKVPGVKIPHIVSASSKWIDETVNGYGNPENINVKTIPISGYFKIENFNNISYVV